MYKAIVLYDVCLVFDFLCSFIISDYTLSLLIELSLRTLKSSD